MSDASATTALIVDTPRGPCVAGTRITIYAIMDSLKSGLSPESIKQDLLISDEQFDEALRYLAAHQAEMERDYAEIMRRSEERRTHYERLYQARTRLSPKLSGAKRAEMMREELARKERNSANE